MSSEGYEEFLKTFQSSLDGFELSVEYDGCAKRCLCAGFSFIVKNSGQEERSIYFDRKTARQLAEFILSVS